MAWLFLILAGAFEIGFTTFMKLSAGFTRPLYVVGFFICAIASFACLNKAMAAIPLGTAYAVWTGIGAFGTAIVGMLFFGDPVGFTRIALLCVLIGTVAALKFA